MLRTCRFKFAFMIPDVFDGFTDGSRWNGFLNVHITRQTAEQILASRKRDGAEDDEEDAVLLRACAASPKLFQPGALVVLPDGAMGSIVHVCESGAFEIELSADRSTVTLSEGQFEPLVDLSGGWATQEVR